MRTTTFKAVSLSAGLAMLATTAQADWHHVDIYDGAYLPAILYINPGDGIVFNNRTDAAHTVAGPEGTWTTGAIQPGERALLEMPRSGDFSFSGVATDGTAVEGLYTFDPIPVDE